jgi:uncharacterized membrane protein HdeD (DUF308 family)
VGAALRAANSRRNCFQGAGDMLDKAKRISTVLVIRGLLALVFGVLMLSLEPATLVSVVITMFGVFAIVDGTFAVVGALASSEAFEDWWLILLAGVLGILIGIFTFSHPAMVATVLVMYIGFRAILQGVLEIAFAMQLRRVIKGEWLFVLGGFMSIVFGLIMIMFPIKSGIVGTAEGITVIGWLIGIYAIVGGAMQLVLAGQMKDWVKRIEEKHTTTTPPTVTPSV